MNYPEKLTHYYPGAQWSLNGEAYSGLTWIGPGTKPTEAELDALAWPPITTFDELKTTKLAALAERRWKAETGGVSFGGSIIRSDAKSQAKINGAVTLFERDPTLEFIDFEAQPNEWVTLDAASMEAAGIAVGRHVQACFSNAKTLSLAITAAADQAALDAIDIEAGWPV